MTRSFLDAYILEVMRNLPPQMLSGTSRMRVFGEITLEASSDDLTLSGCGDWMMAYGERNANLHNVSLTGEAKNKGDGAFLTNSAIFQLLTYMLVVHRARRQVNKEHPCVFGFLTNQTLWRFYKIDDVGEIFSSAIFALSAPREQEIILGNLLYIFQQAQMSSQTTTPAQSVEDIPPGEAVSSTSIDLSGRELAVELEFHTFGESFVLEEEEKQL